MLYRAVNLILAPWRPGERRGNFDYMITTEEKDKLRGWFAGRLPEGVYTELVDVTVDREEITVIGSIPAPEVREEASTVERDAAVDGRISEFRERTRQQRMEVAREAEKKFDKKVSWGVQCGDKKALFTHISVPVMTRLRQPERLVLDTLVQGGVARSRSEALAWCVRLVQRNADDWLSELRGSLEHVKQVRAQGPDRDAT